MSSQAAIQSADDSSPAVQVRSRDRWRIPAFFLLIALLALPAILPFFVVGFPTTSDGELHLMRLASLHDALGRGLLFPRWLSDLFLGYGYPLFNFYGPAVYYVAEALHLLGLSLATAYVTTVTLLIMGGGWGMFLLAEDFWRSDEGNGQWAALLAAAAYLYMPYLLSNAYIRGAFAELGAQALLPWIFWSTRRLLTDPRPERFVSIAVISLGGLAVTHTISLLFLPPVLLIYVGVLAWQESDAGHLNRRALQWLLISGAAAVGVSAFFWLPLIAERDDLARLAYTVAHLPDHVWTWRNWIQWRWFYAYTPTTPFRLGAVQVIIALLGVLLARRRGREWWFWLGLALAGVLGVSQLALPLWQSLELLQIAQFPWRLLSFIGLALALLSGGLVARWRSPWTRVVVAVLAISLIALAQEPHAKTLDMTALGDITVTQANVAHYEAAQNAYGASWTREFLPRWAEDFSPDSGDLFNIPGRRSRTSLSEAEDGQPGPQSVSLRGVAADDGMELAVTAAEAAPLQLGQFYFPGWRAWLDDQPVTPYPSPERGLLTVDVPAGEHSLRVAWGDTPPRRLGAWITLASLLLLGGALWRLGRRRTDAVAWWTVAALFAFAMFAPTGRAPVLERLEQPVSVGELELLGYATACPDAQALHIYPYWYVRATGDDITWRWQLVDEAGQVAAEADGQPWFGVLSPASWGQGAVMRDGVRLWLPPGTPPGDYGLRILWNDGSGETAEEVGPVTLTTGAPAPTAPLGVTFADPDGPDRVALDGVELRLNGRVVPPPGEGPPLVVRPGDRLRYRLFWRAAGPVSEDYHSFVHLLDVERKPLTGQDQMPGTDLNPPSLWNPFYAQPDTLSLAIPADVTSGLYTPQAGLYSFEDGRRLEARSVDSALLGDGLDLPPVKALNSPRVQPEVRVGATFEGVGRLLGYDLALPEDGLQAGDAFTVTLLYRGKGPTAVDYTQFVHLASDELGMAAQSDQPPQNGANPTSSWVRSEVIVSPVALTVDAAARPGVYQLRIGFYDPQTGVRVAAGDKSGHPLPDDQVILREIEIE